MINFVINNKISNRLKEVFADIISKR